MFKYLIISLADDSVYFCHYNRGTSNGKTMPIDVLKNSIRLAMKENLNIQILYPDYELTSDYKEAIDSIDHADIVSSLCEDRNLRKNADIVVFDSWAAIERYPIEKNQAYIIRTSKEDFFENSRLFGTLLKQMNRLVVVFTDVDAWSDADFQNYGKILENLVPVVAAEFVAGHYVQFGPLTDRLFLDRMNNCNAGYESLTVAPDGNLYACPAFYYDGMQSVGNVESGALVKNPQLYQLDYAPICRICDAYHCRRCVWLNKRTTKEINTPSHEQCVMAHIERNASRKLLEAIRKGIKETEQFMPGKEIAEIDYLDPFDLIVK